MRHPYLLDVLSDFYLSLFRCQWKEPVEGKVFMAKTGSGGESSLNSPRPLLVPGRSCFVTWFHLERRSCQGRDPAVFPLLPDVACMPGERCADRACHGLFGQALSQSSLLAALSAVLTTAAEPNTWTETASVFAGMFVFKIGQSVVPSVYKWGGS